MRSLRAAVIRAQMRKPPGGAVFFLSWPLRRVAAALMVAAVLGGCATAAKTVATQQVARDFYRARFDQACHVERPPEWCFGFDLKLNKMDRSLEEATAALHWVQTAKASMPLQLKAVKDDRAALEKGYRP